MVETWHIATYRWYWGAHGERPEVHISADRSAVAFVTGGTLAFDRARRVTFGDRTIVVARFPFGIVPELFRCAISPRGTKVAVLHLEPVRGGYWYGVSINGERAYEIPVGTPVTLLDWLSEDEVVWGVGRSVADDGAPAAYVNGTGVPDTRVAVARVGAYGSCLLVMREGDGSFFVADDGERLPWPPPERPLSLDARLSDAPDGCRVSCGQVRGPSFARVARLAAGERVVYDRSGSHQAYVGERKAVGGAVLLDFLEQIGGPRLFRRHVVVCDQIPWERGYADPVTQLALSPGGSLAAVIAGDEWQRVAVNGNDGPRFEEIYALTWLASSDAFAYVGRSGDEYYAVRAS